MDILEISYGVKQSGSNSLLAPIVNLLNDLSFGVIVATSELELVHQNSRAKTITDKRRGLSLCGNTIKAVSPAGQRLLETTIEATIRQASSISTSARMPIALPAGFDMCIQHVIVHAAPRKETDLVTIILGASDSEAPVREDFLSLFFDLTPCECAVAKALLQGKTVNSIASSLNLSSNTVKTHASHIYAKTGVNRQIELIQLAHRKPVMMWNQR